jgi:BMFP domain-containing protein YqiC
MTEEQLKLEHNLRERQRELAEAENTADDIVKTIRQHIYPTPGTDFKYLDSVNITKFEIQAEHLTQALRRRDTLKRQISEIRQALG